LYAPQSYIKVVAQTIQ